MPVKTYQEIIEDRAKEFFEQDKANFGWPKGWDDIPELLEMYYTRKAEAEMMSRNFAEQMEHLRPRQSGAMAKLAIVVLAMAATFCATGHPGFNIEYVRGVLSDSNQRVFEVYEQYNSKHMSTREYEQRISEIMFQTKVDLTIQ